MVDTEQFYPVQVCDFVIVRLFSSDGTGESSKSRFQLAKVTALDKCRSAFGIGEDEGYAKQVQLVPGGDEFDVSGGEVYMLYTDAYRENLKPLLQQIWASETTYRDWPTVRDGKLSLEVQARQLYMQSKESKQGRAFLSLVGIFGEDRL